MSTPNTGVELTALAPAANAEAQTFDAGRNRDPQPATSTLRNPPDLHGANATLTDSDFSGTEPKPAKEAEHGSLLIGPVTDELALRIVECARI